MRMLAMLSAVGLLSICAFAQNGACTDESIRKSIAANENDTVAAEDLYISSPAFEKPIVGKAELQSQRQRVLSSRANEKHGPWNIGRIVVASSADMAYEYGTRDLSYDDKKTGNRLNFTNAYLRVWKTVDGSCKVAAIMYEHEGAH
jgi:ketosteroid isomerase-like protein